VDRTGAVYVASRPARTTTCTIRKFRADGNGRWQPDRTLTFGPGTGHGDQAGAPKVTAMATDPAGNLYLADASNGIVWGAGPALDTVAVVAGGYPYLAPVASPRALDPPLYQLHGIAVSPHGDLVLSSGNGVIQITAPGFVPPAPAAHPVDTPRTQPGDAGPASEGIPPPPPPPESDAYGAGPDPLAEARNRAGKGGGGNKRLEPPDLIDQLRRKQKEKAKRAAGNAGGGGGMDAQLAEQREAKAKQRAAEEQARLEAIKQAEEANAQRRRKRNQAPGAGSEAGQAPSSSPHPSSSPQVPAKAPASSPQVPASASSSSPQVPAKVPAKAPAKNQPAPDRPHALPENLMSGIRALGGMRPRLTADQIKAREAEYEEQSRQRRTDNPIKKLLQINKFATARAVADAEDANDQEGKGERHNPNRAQHGKKKQFRVVTEQPKALQNQIPRHAKIINIFSLTVNHKLQYDYRRLR